ncbi:hypothetical protein X943_000485, partial [Babesia divergens]
KDTPGGGHITDPHKGHEKCIQNYAEALKDCLPKTYAALYYLYFMGSQSLKETIKGGQWKDYACDGLTYDYGRGHGRGSKVDLHLWLTDVKGSGTGLVKRGFTHSDKHSFTNKKGSDVATAIANIITHDSVKALQKVLCGLMFVCTWDHSLLGHVCLFLYHFCEKVMEDQVGGDLQRKWEGEKYKVNFDSLNTVCTELQKRLLPFTGSVSHESYIIAVYNGSNTNLFEEIWDENKFVKYCKWLEKHLPRIIESLASMSKDSENWKSSSLTNASSPGPFKYGFVFKDKGWEGGRIHSNLQPLIKSLTGGDSGSLNSLLQCLKGPEAPSSQAQVSHASDQPASDGTSGNSGVTAAGASVGVISLGGAGAGVAYGFNLFGLKDIMSGVFGAIRGLVVGF